MLAVGRVIVIFLSMSVLDRQHVAQQHRLLNKPQCW